MKLIVEDQEGAKTEVPFASRELSIGRQAGNAVRLDARNVSRRHARLIRSNGTVLVEDLGSFNGVRVNGEPIQGQVPVGEGDQISIGDYNLAIEEGDPIEAAFFDDVVGSLSSTDPGARNIRTAVIKAPPELMRPAGAIPLRPGERPILERIDGGEPLEIATSDVVIGRDATQSDLLLDHRSISRRHARIWLDPDASWHISDLNSINGLRVNREPYRDSPLRPGDEVELGHVRLRFVPPGARSGPAKAAPSGLDFAGTLPRWPLIAGLVTLVALIEILRWSGSLSRVTPYFGLLVPDSLRSQTQAPRPSPPPAVQAAPAPSPPPPTPPAAEQTPAVQPPLAVQPTPAPEAPPEAIERKVVAIPARRTETASKPRPTQTTRASVETLDATTAPDPARATQAYDDAISLINSSDFQDALGKLHQALQLNPQLAEAHKAMGICFANLHQPDKGAFHYEQYLKLRPQAADAANVRRLLSDYYKTLPDRGATPAPPGPRPP